VVLRGASGDAQAWLDSVSSWGGVFATWLVARKVLECWLYWILIDALSMLLYLRTGLHATAALYALYTVLAYLGWREWLAHYRRENASPANA
jgi:nicotinamide mononucleotide transporter